MNEQAIASKIDEYRDFLGDAEKMISTERAALQAFVDNLTARVDLLESLEASVNETKSKMAELSKLEMNVPSFGGIPGHKAEIVGMADEPPAAPVKKPAPAPVPKPVSEKRVPASDSPTVIIPTVVPSADAVPVAEADSPVAAEKQANLHIFKQSSMAEPMDLSLANEVAGSFAVYPSTTATALSALRTEVVGALMGDAGVPSTAMEIARKAAKAWGEEKLPKRD